MQYGFALAESATQEYDGETEEHEARYLLDTEEHAQEKVARETGIRSEVRERGERDIGVVIESRELAGL